MKTHIITAFNLTSECWAIQVWGKRFCKTCRFRNTRACGGQNIRKTGRNKINKRVPIH